MITALKVAPKWVSGRKLWAVWDGDGQQLSGAYYTRDEALARWETLVAAERQKRTAGERPCMCCGRTFLSEGIHNRLCQSCGRGVPNYNW